MKAIPCDWSEMFAGGVPGWVIFGMEVQDIKKRLASCSSDDLGTSDNNLAELSVIGLIAYFEGFARYHFAACVNICPRLLSGFAEKRPDAVATLRDISEMDTVHGKIGFLIADRLGFTTPKEINGHFRDILSITPFSKNEHRKYDRILHDRHQIVHSAGICTTKYLRAHDGMLSEGRDRPYMDSVVITPSRAIEVADFLLAIAEKIVKASHKRLTNPESWHSITEMNAMQDHMTFLEWSSNAFLPEQ